MSRYRKIEVRTWGDAKFRELSLIPPCGQGLWLYLLTGPHTGPIPGLFRAGRAALAEELGWDLKAFDKALKEIVDKGMAKVDPSARLVWIPNAVKHNSPESPNVIKGWAKEFALLPESPIKNEALVFLLGFAKGLPEGFGKAFLSSFAEEIAKVKRIGFQEDIGKSSANQEQEQEQDTLYPSQEVSSLRIGLSSVSRNGCAHAWSGDDPFGPEEVADA